MGAGLNYLASDFTSMSFAAGSPNGAQRACFDILHTRAARMLERLDAYSGVFDDSVTPDAVLARFRSKTQPWVENGSADLVDVPDQAALVDPLDAVDAEARTVLSDPALLFPSACWSSLPAAKPVGLNADSYAALTARLFRHGKVCLSRSAIAKASVFLIGKRGGSRLREIWSGNHISAFSRRPPAPPRLGNPGVFKRIIRRAHDTLFFSKRDAKAYFDQLRLPVRLRPYFGRPPLRASRLCKALKCTLPDLARHLVDADSRPLRSKDQIVPQNCTWAMGFSWSSFVAQSKLLSVARAAGLQDDQILTLEEPHPSHPVELVTIATDDAVFAHTSRAQAVSRLALFDDALIDAGIIRNRDKDECAELSTVALGCHLGNTPPWVEPDLGKIINLVLGTVGFTAAATTTPRVVSALVGIAGWFAQLTQWHYSVFNRVYDITKNHNLDDEIPATVQAKDELAVFVALAPLLVADMARPYLPLLACSDASPSFGYGVSVRSIGADLAEDLASKSEHRGDYLVFDDPLPKTEGQRRTGSPVRLPFSMESFTDVLSIKATTTSHSGGMEAHAVLLMIQWLLRSTTRFSSRAVVGIDATAVLAAMLKGRSSAPTLRRPVRAVAAHCLAGDLLLLPLWVPSRFNPADKPSRGVRRRPAVRRAGKPYKPSVSERAAAARRHEYEHFLRTSPYAGEFADEPSTSSCHASSASFTSPEELLNTYCECSGDASSASSASSV